ncbi:MAG: hypothetical protein JNJ61_08605 [Anaerolineae bacterium]|nr:hypothetical protein [Anaerolineae bacterium]
MSTVLVKTLVCDGCGAVIDMDFYIRLQYAGQRLLQQNPNIPLERDFCCEACKEWWLAQYSHADIWGPPWEEREWWRDQVEQMHEHVPVRTTHDVMPLVDTHAHFEDPEPLK